jgi:hypothetical protein
MPWSCGPRGVRTERHGSAHSPEVSLRSPHELIMRIADGDAHARAAIEEFVISLDLSGAAEDVSQALQILQVMGPTELSDSILIRLQENDYRVEQQPPLIG